MNCRRFFLYHLYLVYHFLDMSTFIVTEFQAAVEIDGVAVVVKYPRNVGGGVLGADEFANAVGQVVGGKPEGVGDGAPITFPVEAEDGAVVHGHLEHAVVAFDLVNFDIGPVVADEKLGLFGQLLFVDGIVGSYGTGADKEQGEQKGGNTFHDKVYVGLF